MVIGSDSMYKNQDKKKGFGVWRYMLQCSIKNMKIMYRVCE